MKLREALQALADAIERDGDPAFAHLLIEARAALAEPVADEPAPGYCKHCKKYTIAEPLPAAPVADEPVAPINEGKAWSFCRKVIADGRDILAWHPDEGYERQSARMDAQAAKRADELMAALRAYVDADRAQRVPLPDRLIRFTLRDLKVKREALSGFVAVGNELERAREYDQWILSLERYIEAAQDSGAVEHKLGIGAKP